jgi:hypothetical protein
MANQIETTEREIMGSTLLGDLLTIYIGDKVLTTFKKEKMGLYHRILQQFTVIEVSNSHVLSSFWSNVLQNEKVTSSA